jgi:cell division protein ZapA
MNDEFNILKVNIYGTEYPVKGSTDPDYINEVAKYVDTKMKEINKNISIDSSLKVAILAALNITDELFREKNKDRSSPVQFDFNIRIHKLNKELHECLEKINQ